MIAILGAGISGLAAGFELIKNGVPGEDVLVIEKDDAVGGLAQTRTVGDFSFDLGPHRWFTKLEWVDGCWDEINGTDVLTLDRLTRIWYKKKLICYPLQPLDILANVGALESAAFISSYLRVQLNNLITKKSPKNLEEALVLKFGQSLYNSFFKEYNISLWGGEGCKELAPDWAQQRVKNLSLGRALLDAFGLVSKGSVISLVDQFKYPAKGVGQLAERFAAILTSAGVRIICAAEVTEVVRTNNRITGLFINRSGVVDGYDVNYCISSVPIDQLVKRIRDPLPAASLDASQSLRYRDMVFITLFIDLPVTMRDHWIYVQDSSLSFNRFMDMGNWNQALSPDGTTSLVFEVACSAGDGDWCRSDAEWIERISNEAIREFGFFTRNRIIGGVVFRKTHAYPVYSLGYMNHLNKVKQSLKMLENLQLIGRNGLFRYNNMDHSMATGMIAARNYLGESIDVERINDDQEYLEMKRTGECSAYEPGRKA